MQETFKREIGAELRGNECYFKVWAPNAQAVYPIFEKNRWNKIESDKLTPTTDDYWEGVVKGVHPKDKYKYLIIPQGITGMVNKKEYQKLDPAARHVVHDYLYDPKNAGMVVNPEYNWAPFESPKFENYIIYQLHVGSFAGNNDEFCEEIDKLPDKVARFKHIEAKLGYIKDMQFDAIELLPTQEFANNQSWGYNPSFYFAPESSYGSPDDLRNLVNESHKIGLAVIFDVVFNHMTGKDLNNPFAEYDITGKRIFLSDNEFSGGKKPEFAKKQVREFFFDNIKLYFDMYNADGIRFDFTNEITNADGGWDFLKDLIRKIKEKYPNKYLIAEHFSEHDATIREMGFDAIWFVTAHHELQKAMDYEKNDYGEPLGKLKAIIGKDFGFGQNYPNQWNLIKAMLGSHDETGDLEEHSWQSPDINWVHQYFTEFFGGRDNWLARAKARMSWALNVASMGTPMLFAGTECHMPGYWNDHPHDHFNWSFAGDSIGMSMRRMVRAANEIRFKNPALRSENLVFTHEDYDNKIMAFIRWEGNNVVLVVVNLSDRDFSNRDYGVRTGGQRGQWTQIFCSQDEDFDGWDGAGNAFYEPDTGNHQDPFININVPKYSVIMMRLKN